MLFEKLKFLIVLGCILWKSVQTAEVQSRIVGGQQTTISQAKYLVQVRRGDTLCGGSLIRPRWVITAAHCAEGYQASAFTIIGGTSILDGSNGVRRSVSLIVVHPKYNSITYNMDVALFKLNSAMTGTNIQTITLGGAVSPGSNIRVFGWGITSENGNTASNQVRSMTIPVWGRPACRKAYQNTMNITPSMVCAGAEGMDHCSGDSGGPGVQNNTLVAIVSAGIGCARPGFPGLYTRVGRIRKWARQVIQNNK